MEEGYEPQDVIGQVPGPIMRLFTLTLQIRWVSGLRDVDTVSNSWIVGTAAVRRSTYRPRNIEPTDTHWDSLAENKRMKGLYMTFQEMNSNQSRRCPKEENFVSSICTCVSPAIPNQQNEYESATPAQLSPRSRAEDHAPMKDSSGLRLVLTALWVSWPLLSGERHRYP